MTKIKLRQTIQTALTIALSVTLVGCDSAQRTISGPVEGNSFAVANVRVFDGTQTIENTTVVVREGLIDSVEVEATPPPGLPILDGHGLTLIPGLIDAHTHTYYEGALIDALRFGVTTELDMLTSVDFAARYKSCRDSMERTRLADLWTSVRLVTAKRNEWLQNPTLSSPGEAEEFVLARINEGSDYIKIHYEPNRPEFVPVISKDTLDATVMAAHAHSKLAVVHVTQLEPTRDAVEAHVDGLAHVFSDEVIDAALLKRMKLDDTFVIATLSVFIAGQTDEEPWKDLIADDRLAPYLSEDQLASLRFLETNELDNSRIDPEISRSNVLHLQTQGLDVLAGTDAPNPGTAHGVSLHGELAELVKAGLTPAQALAATTSLPAERFGLKDRGRIEPGLRADLVLVDGDPTSDITATRAIARIFKNGYQVNRLVPTKPPDERDASDESVAK